jgi:hypothetical protein
MHALSRQSAAAVDSPHPIDKTDRGGMVAMLSACPHSQWGVHAFGVRKEWYDDHQRKPGAEVLRQPR